MNEMIGGLRGWFVALIALTAGILVSVSRSDVITSIFDIDDQNQKLPPLELYEKEEEVLGLSSGKKNNDQDLFFDEDQNLDDINNELYLYESKETKIKKNDFSLSGTYKHQEKLNPNLEYTNEWVVTVKGGHQAAHKLAKETNYDLVGPVRGFDNTYVFQKSDHPIRSKRNANHHTAKLSSHEKVLFAEQQTIKRRSKRDLLNPWSDLSRKNVDLLFNDPFWPKQWPLHDTRTLEDLPKLDLHVIGAWKKNYTGRGVVVTILDDGIQWNHTDLAKNYDPLASYDLNDNDTDPMPTFDDNNRHGTRCAGEVAMVANNRFCGVGVAYDAKIGGIRMLDGRITDRLEAEALQFHIQHVDIFSASWGPNDDGRTVEGPGTLAEKAIMNGIKNGRGGKGIIYIWASGNGGTFDDDCDCDGYSDSIYTLSVSSASQSGKFPWYGEPCASTLAATYSSGTYTDQKITTTDTENQCTSDHTGTSASAPLAAGIVALGLEANPKLTWRDVQHVVVWSSEPSPLAFNREWHKNGRGLLANNRFGFGLMNAEAFVTLAEKWINVPKQKTCTTTFPGFTKRLITPYKVTVVRFRTDRCKGQYNEVNYLEHVQIVTDIDYTLRGNLAIYVTSPNKRRKVKERKKLQSKEEKGWEIKKEEEIEDSKIAENTIKKEKRSMKTATERMRNILQDFHSGPSRCRNDSKQGISTGEICSYVQKSILMLQNELFSELHNRLPKFFNAIDLYRVIDNRINSASLLGIFYWTPAKYVKI
uniref:Uncharacterized protein n=1 Tax=Romanomermis culicivorax TaxID=13658 RepID=A0A915JTX1_ROMCU